MINRSGVAFRVAAPLLAYAALTAAMDVYGGNRLQTITPESLAAVSFTFTAAFFIGSEALRNGSASFRMMREHGYDVIAINITTAVTWLATFYALQNLEPAVVNVVGLGLIPVCTVFAGPLLRRGSSVLGMEVAAALGICAFMAILVWGTFAGRTGIGEIRAEHAAWGLIAAVICALGSAGNIIYMKRLSDAGQSPQAVLAVRFGFTIVIGWLLMGLGSRSDLAEAVVPGAIVAVIGVGLPIYVLQRGIKHTEPIIASLFVSLSPLFAFMMQLLDGRLHPSTLTILGIVGIVSFAAVGTIARGRLDRRTAMRAARVEAAAEASAAP